MLEPVSSSPLASTPMLIRSFIYALALATGSVASAQPFAPPATPTRLAPGTISTPQGEYSPTFDIARGELYFMRRTPGAFDYTIYVASWTGSEWTEPAIAPFTGTYRDAAPHLSPDGSALYFDSKRPAAGLATNSINLWRVARTANGWAEPHLLRRASEHAAQSEIAQNDEFGPAVDAAGTLYFYSFRQPLRGGAHYAVSLDANGREREPVRRALDLPDPSASQFIAYTYVFPDGQRAIMEGRAVGRRDSDLFHTCRRPNGSWTAPEPIDAVNTVHGEGGPYVSADGATLFFSSARPLGDARATNADLYAVAMDALGISCDR